MLYLRPNDVWLCNKLAAILKTLCPTTCQVAAPILTRAMSLQFVVQMGLLCKLFSAKGR